MVLFFPLFLLLTLFLLITGFLVFIDREDRSSVEPLSVSSFVASEFTDNTLSYSGNEYVWDTTIMTFKEPFEYYLDSGMVWKIKDQKDSILYHGVGNIESKFLSVPGSYVLDLTQPSKFGMGRLVNSGLPLNHDTCNHSPFPDFLLVVVSDVHLKFDFSTIKFSKSLKGGVIDGTQVSLQGLYEQYEGNEFDPRTLKIVASGIEALVEGSVLSTTEKLKKGNIMLTYELSGTLKRQTYIQLDFYDPNKQIQSYHHLNIID